jgi:hypothetical protein
MAGRVVLEVLRHVWGVLVGLNYPIALMGGLALGFWERFRMTHDVDILIGIEPDRLEEVLRRLEVEGIFAKKHPSVLTLENVRLVPLLYQPPSTFVDVQVDLLLAESEFHREALARRIPARLPDTDTDLFVVTCEDLIIFKVFANRPRDHGDVLDLLQLHRSKLDFPHIARWIGKLDLSPRFAVMWREALPHEPLPVEFIEE